MCRIRWPCFHQVALQLLLNLLNFSCERIVPFSSWACLAIVFDSLFPIVNMLPHCSLFFVQEETVYLLCVADYLRKVVKISVINLYYNSFHISICLSKFCLSKLKRSVFYQDPFYYCYLDLKSWISIIYYRTRQIFYLLWED